MSGPTCPVLLGETAVGKTALVVELARRCPLEVISLDSRQIYHEMRIGTAQPTAEELAVCPHHLIDFVSPLQKYSAARFRSDFEAVFRQIINRDGRPLLVGGAGLYLTALREGLLDLPAGSAEKTTAVRQQLAAHDDGEIRRRLAAVDPDSFARIHPHDRYRSQRALEIFLLTGRTMTELTVEQESLPSLGLEFRTLWLTRPVAELDARISARTKAMLARGWIEETRDLLDRHGPAAPGLATLGYREIVAWLAGNARREDLAERIVLATRQYAKRQRTWFRGLVHVGSGSPADPATIQQAVALLEL